MAFDPDAFLSQQGQQFDPDAFLASASQAPAQSPQAPPASSDRIGGPWGSVLDYFNLQKQAQAPEQQSVGAKALEAAGRTVNQFVPRSVEAAASLATPAVQGIEDLYNAPSNIQQAYQNRNLPGQGPIYEAEQTPPYSQERFNVGADIVGQMLMAKGLHGQIGAELPKLDALRSKSPERVPMFQTPVDVIGKDRVSAISADSGNTPTAQIDPDAAVRESMAQTSQTPPIRESEDIPQSPNLPRSERTTNTGISQATTGYTYVTPEGESWWSKAAQLQQDFFNTKPKTPERAAARKAFEDHQNQVYGKGNRFSRIDENGNQQSAGDVGLAENSERIFGQGSLPQDLSGNGGRIITPVSASETSAAKQVAAPPAQIRSLQPETTAQAEPSVATRPATIPTPERITGASIRTRDGEIFTSYAHPAAQQEAYKAGYKIGDTVDSGFTTDTGRFVDKQEAHKIAVAAKQTSPPASAFSKKYGLEASRIDLQPQQPASTIQGTPDELSSSQAQAGQRDTALRAEPEPAAVGGAGAPEGAEGGQGAAAGTSNRQNIETYGEGAVPSGQGVDTGQLLDSARAAIRSGGVDPYSVLSRTRQKGVANPEEYAALAAEHERLVNDAVAKEKAGDPAAQEAAQQANDFANAIQPHKTAASDLFRLMQGDLNYDLSTSFGIDQYMKSELGRGLKASERPAFEQRARGIRQAESGVADAVTRSDAKVQGRYRNVRDITMEEAASRIREQLKPCQV